MGAKPASGGCTRPRIAESVARAARGTAVRRVWLFGSRARGDAREGSDVDLCVEADRGFSLVDAGLFSEAVARGCGAPVDVVSGRFLTPTTRASIERDRVLVYERETALMAGDG